MLHDRACRRKQLFERPILLKGRALLIDKDLSPQWTVAQIADLPDSLVDEHFVGYWEAEDNPHPLADLPTFPKLAQRQLPATAPLRSSLSSTRYRSFLMPIGAPSERKQPESHPVCVK